MAQILDSLRAARPSPPGPLARRPGIGYILFCIMLLVFAVLTLNVLTNGPLTGYDSSVIESIHAQATHGPATVVQLMKLGSAMGFWGVSLLILFFFVLWLVQRRWRELTMLVLGVVGGAAILHITAALIFSPAVRISPTPSRD